MAKICFPHYERGDFESLKETYEFFSRENRWHEYMLEDIIRYNVIYRDYLRKNGYYALIDRLVSEGCPIARDYNLSPAFCTKGRVTIKDYDIQCYNIKDDITILGHTFKGLKDIMAHCEIYGNECYSGFKCYVPDEYKVYRDIHIGEIYQHYPTFDSFDACDNRCYRNFIFSKEAITAQEMEKVFSATPHTNNFCMVHETIDWGFLPILYYSGEGDYMLLASNNICDRKKVSLQ